MKTLKQNKKRNDQSITQEAKMDNLRGYQRDGLKEISQGFKTSNRGIVDWATGLGKTRLGISHVSTEKYNNVIWFAPTLILVDQTAEAFSEHLGLDFNYIFIASDEELGTIVLNKNPNSKRIGVFSGEASIPSIAAVLKEHSKTSKRLIVFSTYHSSHLLHKAYLKAGVSNDIAIYDEGHHLAKPKSSSWVKVLDPSFPSKRRLLLSATRIISKTNKKLSMDNEAVFGPVFTRKSTSWGITNGWLSPFRILTTAYLTDRAKQMANKKSILSIPDLAMPITVDAIATALGTKEILDKHSKHHAIVFCSNSNRAKTFKTLWSHLYPEVPAYYVDGTTPGYERERILKAYEDSKKAILINIRVLTEGFDAPVTDTVVYLDPKTSPKDIQQSFGRGLRARPNKKDCIILLPATVLDHEDAEESVLRSAYAPLINVIRALGEFDTSFQMIASDGSSINSSFKTKIMDNNDENKVLVPVDLDTIPSYARKIFLKELSPKRVKQIWDLESVTKIAKNYKNREAFRYGNPSAHSWAYSRGLLDIVFSHMPKINRTIGRSREDVEALVKKCKTRGEFRKKHKAEYAWLQVRGILEEVVGHLPETFMKHSNEKLIAAAKECSTTIEMREKHRKIYNWALGNGKHKLVVANLKKGGK